ncbi:MAG: outer membrane protein assembly factor BamE [Pseudomonadota bacterium]
MRFLIKKSTYLAVIFVVTILSSACVSLLPDGHKIDIHQGNIIDRERLEQVQTGMNRDQVRFLLGSPVTQNPFHADRWDYLHYISKAGSHKEPKRVSIFFADNQVVAIDDQYISQD